jgi:hypothetical protein
MNPIELLERDLADVFADVESLDIRETPVVGTEIREIRDDLTILAMNKPKTN